MLVVRLPHLSRFGIFGRLASTGAVAELTDAIAASLEFVRCACLLLAASHG